MENLKFKIDLIMQITLLFKLELTRLKNQHIIVKEELESK
jgi:hypothetical protein